MPTIAEAAQQLVADPLPVLFIDTCVLLDVIRAPLRRIPGSIQAAIALTEMRVLSRCRIVASSKIQEEWSKHEDAVKTELDRHLAARDRDAVAFHEACKLVKLPLAFALPSYQSVGLVERLHSLAADLLTNATHLLPSDETKLRAYNRSDAGLPPAQRGGGHGDCTIIEEYLELCRILQSGGFAKTRVFCSSNTEDYQDGHKLHDALAGEFASAGLVFTNALHWAVKELTRAPLALPDSEP